MNDRDLLCAFALVLLVAVAVILGVSAVAASVPLPTFEGPSW